MELFEDGIGTGRSSKRLAILAMRSNEMVDALNDLLDAGERAATDGFVSNQGEEPLVGSLIRLGLRLGVWSG